MAFLMFAVGLELELDALFEVHGVSWLVIEDMLTVERGSLSALHSNFLSQTDTGSTGKSALTSCNTSVPPLLSRPTVHISLFSSWTR